MQSFMVWRSTQFFVHSHIKAKERSFLIAVVKICFSARGHMNAVNYPARRHKREKHHPEGETYDVIDSLVGPLHMRRS